ncbi:MAG: SUMF1/EgtB/PvdO family nonheme iron enzyme, partial [Verrucomicrobia bacterium]|nr:SUMF1/EgtB/PvdO family nonheme iron enzyme [Verrucomicrobiota bacterium]
PNLDEIGWYWCNSASKTHPAGQKLPNAWGLYDMHGNVYEWCLDQKNKYPETPVTDPVGEGTDDYRARRGGSYSYYDDGAKNCRSAARNTGSITMTSNSLGFRVALLKKKVALVITLDDSKEYDGTPLLSSRFKATAAGLMPGDKLTDGIVMTTGSEVGSYSYPDTCMITRPFETAMGITNYNVTYVINQTITPVLLPLTITINVSMQYNGTSVDCPYAFASASGLLPGDKLTNGFVSSTGSEIGSYSYPDTCTIMIPFETALGIKNYNVTYNINMKIVPARLTITINERKEYDGTVLISDYTKATAIGLLDGDKLTAGVVTSAGSKVGSYSYPGTSTITTPFRTAKGIEKYDVTYKIKQTVTGTLPDKSIVIPMLVGVDLTMIWIEPGTFMMGSPSDELGRESREVQHKVTLTKGYWLGKYEVTQAQYEEIMGTNPSDRLDYWGKDHGVGDNYPVYYVSWDDAMAFCKKLTEKEKTAGYLPEGYEYTLPTEAQWEYACRAGTTTALNSGKNLSGKYECPEMDEVGWYEYNSGGTFNSDEYMGDGKT